MRLLFTGTFFKFLLGFTAILAISFTILVIVGYFGSSGADGYEDAALDTGALSG